MVAEVAMAADAWVGRDKPKCCGKQVGVSSKSAAPDVVVAESIQALEGG